MENDISKRLEEIDARLEELPKGTLVYKKIRGKDQPYLQSTVNGRSVSTFIKVGERTLIFDELEERNRLLQEKKRYLAYSSRVLALLKRNPYLNKRVFLGTQDFADLIVGNRFYVDKTDFIREWWETGSKVTLIARPRRFGKSLTLSTLEYFFSARYAGRSDLFRELDIWRHEEYRDLQGTFPVISISLGGLKGRTFEDSIDLFRGVLSALFRQHSYLLDSEQIGESMKNELDRYSFCHSDFPVSELAQGVQLLSEALYIHHDCPVILLIDEYDTPLQEAYAAGYWDSMISFVREFFYYSLKENPFLGRALLTGITRVTKNSLFSDLNHLEVATTTSGRYAQYFGFTEQEVADILRCQSREEMALVKSWYDGFTFGDFHGIYNPWSISCYLLYHKIGTYWANTASDHLISHLIRRGDDSMKNILLTLIDGGSIHVNLDENIVFEYLTCRKDAVCSLLHATGYLKAENLIWHEGIAECDLTITNYETRQMFRGMILRWFGAVYTEYNDFVNALIRNNLERMNEAMAVVTQNLISYFDTGHQPSGREPERFYHGLVLGMIVDLQNRYRITSNRESGNGRYDVMMEPLSEELPAAILEFKVRDPRKEPDLAATASNALRQIREQNYEAELLARGIPEERIYCYGFAFDGKDVLIAGSRESTRPKPVWR